jgi:hypothetical protein
MLWVGVYLAVGVVHGLLVTGLAAQARRGWPVWTTETARGWLVNLCAWPVVAVEALIWGVQATWAAVGRQSPPGR